ncbi:TIM barrel protein [Candidatus Pacearchaeota archaeon]|nr:TIM barrel protein [Candidatus Pacearchaeota archaeon]
MIKIGPAGLGGVKEAAANLHEFAKKEIKACEIAFTYGVYIKEQDALEIGNTARDLDISLSIHAPYWINLNSDDRNKIEQSKKRILDSCNIGDKLGARYVVFHPGYYNKNKEKSFDNIKNAVIDIRNKIKEQGWSCDAIPETMGKVNVFGSIDETLKLVKETSCFFCIDFAHLLARSNGKMTYKEMYHRVEEFPILHCHFSGIVYGDKGEKHHKITPDEEWTALLKVLPKAKDITIINESPEPVDDSVKGLKILDTM